MHNLGWWIIDLTMLLLFVVPAVWFTRQAMKSGDRFQHGAAIAFGSVAAMVVVQITQHGGTV